MGAGCTPDTAIPADTDYEKIWNKSVRKFVEDVFAPVDVDMASRELPAEHREWVEEVRRAQGFSARQGVLKFLL